MHILVNCISANRDLLLVAQDGKSKNISKNKKMNEDNTQEEIENGIDEADYKRGDLTPQQEDLVLDTKEEIMEKERIMDEEQELQSDFQRKNEDGITKFED